MSVMRTQMQSCSVTKRRTEMEKIMFTKALNDDDMPSQAPAKRSSERLRFRKT